MCLPFAVLWRRVNAPRSLAAEDFRRKQAAAAAEELERQMAEKVARDAQLKELYANKVDDNFFSQFGTSHR